MKTSEYLKLLKIKKKLKAPKTEEIKKKPGYPRCISIPREESNYQSKSVRTVKKMLPPDFRIPDYPNE